MAKDCQGTLRGACAVCDCRTFVSDKGIRCDYCDHPAAKHQNLTSPSTKPPSSQPDVVVDADGGVEEDSGEDGLPDMPDEALRGATPSTANVFGAGIYGTSFSSHLYMLSCPCNDRNSVIHCSARCMFCAEYTKV